MSEPAAKEDPLFSKHSNRELIIFAVVLGVVNIFVSCTQGTGANEDRQLKQKVEAIGVQLDEMESKLDRDDLRQELINVKNEIRELREGLSAPTADGK